MNFLEKFKRKKVFRKESGQINANRYWDVLFFAFFILFFLAMFFGYLTFKNTNTEFVVDSTFNKDDAGINQKNKIKKVVDYFSEKEASSLEIINSEVLIIDPSL